MIEGRRLFYTVKGALTRCGQVITQDLTWAGCQDSA